MTCLKIRYTSRYAANTALLQVWVKRQNGDLKRREIAAYRCDRCDGWHLTSQKGISTREWLEERATRLGEVDA